LSAYPPARDDAAGSNNSARQFARHF